MFKSYLAASSFRAATCGLIAACLIIVGANRVRAETDPCRVQQKAFNAANSKFEKAERNRENWLTRVQSKITSLSNSRENALTQAQTFNALKNQCDGGSIGGLITIISVGGLKFKNIIKCRLHWFRMKARADKRVAGFERKIQNFTTAAQLKTDRLTAKEDAARQQRTTAEAALNQCRAQPAPTPTPPSN